MLVLVNGEAREVTPGTTVAEVVESLPGALQGRGVAVALDGEVVPHTQWERTELGDGDRVEVVVAVQGG